MRVLDPMPLEAQNGRNDGTILVRFHWGLQSTNPLNFIMEWNHQSLEIFHPMVCINCNAFMGIKKKKKCHEQLGFCLIITGLGPWIIAQLQGSLLIDTRHLSIIQNSESTCHSALDYGTNLSWIKMFWFKASIKGTEIFF